MRRENLILKKTSKTRSSRGKAPIRMTNEKHPPRRKRHPSKEGNC